MAESDKVSLPKPPIFVRSAAEFRWFKVNMPSLGCFLGLRPVVYLAVMVVAVAAVVVAVVVNVAVVVVVLVAAGLACYVMICINVARA